MGTPLLSGRWSRPVFEAVSGMSWNVGFTTSFKYDEYGEAVLYILVNTEQNPESSFWYSITGHLFPNSFWSSNRYCLNCFFCRKTRIFLTSIY